MKWVLSIRCGESSRRSVRERMFGPRENPKEAPEYELEAGLRLLRFKGFDRRLLADDEL
jgi:hypothetical protein